jgi:hypothetical protein
MLRQPVRSMIREFKGTSEFARLADELPVRARVCLALFAAEIALHHLKLSPDFSLARNGLNLALNWQRGDPINPGTLENALEDEKDGLAFASLRARSEEECLAWNVLQYAIYYAAYHAFRAENRCPSGATSEVDETTLDHLDKDLRALEPSSMALMTRAAVYLKQHPNVTLAQLKAQISKP